MSSPSAVACREVFDENSQPSAEEISEYAQQLGIDPESESHLLPLAKDGLMQALPAPWKAFFDEKLQSHYYYNEETKRTQWEHPLDNVYRELVKKARDASMQDDTCASVQELLTSEENTKNLERVETKVESDDELSTDSENHGSDAKETALAPRRLAPLGRPPLAPLTRIDKKLGELRISPLRRSVDSPLPPRPALTRNASDKDVPNRPKTLFKQQSEIIDLKMHILNSPEDENFSPLLASAKVEKGLPLTGKGSMFVKLMKSELPSPETEKSLPLDSLTKSDPPKGILREKLSDTFHRKTESLFVGKPKHTNSLDEDRKSVRFKLETLPDPTISPGSNSSSEQNEGQSSIISATPVLTIPSPLIPSSPVIPSSPIIPSSSSPATPVPSIPSVLSPLTSRPPLPPRPQSTESLREKNSSDKDSIESDSRERPFDASPRRRVLRPPAADYIKPDLFQKNFQKISDLVRPGDIESAPVNLDEPKQDKDVRPRSPMIPLLKNKISINLMESIESETSIDSPDREFANLDLNDLDDSNENKDLIHDADNKIEYDNKHVDDNSEKASVHSKISLSLKCSSNVSKDFDDSSEKLSTHSKTSVSLKSPNNIPIDLDDNSDKAAAVHSKVTSHKSQHNIPQIPQIRVPKLELLKKVTSDPEESRKNSIEESKSNSKSDSVDIAKDNIPTPQLKVSPTPSSSSELRSPRAEFGRPWSTLSTFKPSNRAIIAPLKSSDSANSLPKGLTSPRLDGVILSQGKSSSDNVVVVYQFETQDENLPKPKSPLIPDMGTRDMIERQKGDERRRLELTLQKELESIRIEWSAREKRMRSELQEELRGAEQKFFLEKRVRLEEQAERHKREMEDALKSNEHKHIEQLKASQQEFEERYRRDCEEASKQFAEKMSTLLKEYKARLLEQQEQLEIENERALSDLSEQLQASLHRERNKMIEENRMTIEVLREEHNARVTDLRHDYRAEVEHLRSQHACHLEELRARLAGERAAGRHHDDRALADKYRCLKEKYARLKHDVKMSIERRNKRREMSMTTGSETEKSNSHKATQSLERCKELNETSVSAVIEAEPTKLRTNNNPTIKYNDNETSFSESNAHKSYDNNNEEWKSKKEGGQLLETPASKPRRRTAVAFREPPRRRRDDRDAATTDCQDSSDATTADEKPKEAVNGHGRRRCFTRLKSASTSRLNYSPKRGEGWSSPLESLRQQLRKLDDLEEQFPDLACQPSYTLRYPFAELAGVVRRADSAELEFVRHRAVVEREGMRRARDVLRRRRAALRENRAALQPHIEPSEEREATELEVALHRARALLGEKEIRLRHIERALRRLPEDHEPLPVQEGATDSASSCSSAERVEAAAGGAVLRSLRALHADVRDIWRALDLKRAHTASPETSSCNAPSTSQTRMTLSAPEPVQQDNSDGSVNEKARGLRAWLQT